ncbi:diguanylate cyclase [Rhodobacterales bacterium]|nr:diguanylate cyclase [Rhodobacterales bacterium]
MEKNADQTITIDLETTFGNLPESVLVTNAERKIVFANRATKELLRLSRTEICASRTQRFFADPKQFEELGRLYRQPETGGSKEAHCIDLRLGDGTIAKVETVTAPLYDTQNNLSGLLVIIRDTREKRALEEQLTAVAVTLEEALDAISEGFALYDSDDRLVICNDNYREIYTSSAPAIFPGNRFEDILRFGLGRKQYSTGDLSDEDWLADRIRRHRNCDGSVIEQRLENGRWLRISETKTTSGGIAGIRADITELKQAQAKAERAYADLALIADSLTVSINELLPDGTCLFTNETGCKWFNASAEELIGKPLRERLCAQDREIVSRHAARAIEERRAVSAELNLQFPDGVHRDCKIDWNPRLTATGEVDRLVVMATDITDRKRTETTLAEVYSLTSSRELGHKEKIDEFLRIGCRHYDLPFGILSHVADNSYAIVNAASPNGELVPGTEFQLADTYCQLTLQATEPLATTKASESNFAAHPCYRNFGLETYIGCPVFVDGLIYGTINFSSPQARKRDFSVSDRQILRRFADWMGHEIARQRDHQALLDAKINLERIASVDDLTQTMNRRAFMEQAQKELMRYRRYNQPFTCVMMDIDHFKLINDRHGHATGDDVLKKFAATIMASLRPVDVFGRIGGEEFCLLLHGTSAGDATTVCDRLRLSIIANCSTENCGPVTCSMGLATVCESDVEFSSLMQKADTALYEAKSSGRNRCVVYTESQSAAVAE